MKTTNALNIKEENYPKPFVKWAGGKTQLIDKIVERLPNFKKNDCNNKIIDKYFEPFVGGGAVFFYLSKNYNINYALLGDTNKNLILTYNVIKHKPYDLINNLKELSDDYKENNDKKEMFYNKRAEFNRLKNTSPYGLSDEHITLASLMIFLNKTCFNGLYRVNKKNNFNVPFANPKNPLICDEKNLIEVSEKLKNVDLFFGDYSESIKNMDNKSLVYFDPPYRPINGKKSFEGYSKSDFNDKHQKELCEFCKTIDKKGVKFILSNSDPKNLDKNDDFFDKLYSEFKIERVYAKRYINSKGNKRGAITELLISNY